LVISILDGSDYNNKIEVGVWSLGKQFTDRRRTNPRGGKAKAPSFNRGPFFASGGASSIVGNKSAGI